MERKEIRSLEKVLKKHENDLIQHSKVNQFAIGYKISHKKIKRNTVGIIIFVTKKYSDKYLLSSKIDPVPKSIDGVKTDVVEIPGGFTLETADDARHRPFSGGVATMSESGLPHYVGTLGLIVKRSAGIQNKLWAITNNHVGANEHVQGMSPPPAKIGEHWTQPGGPNGRKPKDTVALLRHWNRMKPSGPGKINYYDVAVGRITRSSEIYAIPYEVKDIGKVKGIQDATLGDKVMKRGRTTRKRTGEVISVSWRGTVSYNGYPCYFEDQLLITGDPPTTPFSQGGDSGSVVVSATPSASGAHRVNSLLFAGGSGSNGIKYTIASPFRRIANDFKLIL